MERKDVSATVLKVSTHLWIVIATLVAIFLLAACGEDVPRDDAANDSNAQTPSPSSLARIAIAATETPVRTPTPVTPMRTLPPSWTPTFTATASDTPTTTLTPTPSPTLSAQDVCESSTVSITLVNGETYDSGDAYDLIATMPLLDSAATIRFEHLESGESESLNIPGGNAYLGRIPLDLNAGPGTYRWTISISTSNYSDICVTSGEFTLNARDPMEALFEAYADLRDAVNQPEPTQTSESG